MGKDKQMGCIWEYRNIINVKDQVMGSFTKTPSVGYRKLWMNFYIRKSGMPGLVLFRIYSKLWMGRQLTWKKLNVTRWNDDVETLGDLLETDFWNQVLCHSSSFA